MRHLAPYLVTAFVVMAWMTLGWILRVDAVPAMSQAAIDAMRNASLG
ncbi:MAG: hypothetical protein ABIU76_15525 [Gemmatimonadaceae bacterium]